MGLDYSSGVYSNCVSISELLKDADVGSFDPYAVAAVLVLLPVSFITDFFYSKREPGKKTGAATIVMVIHAVLYALRLLRDKPGTIT